MGGTMQTVNTVNGEQVTSYAADMSTHSVEQAA